MKFSGKMWLVINKSFKKSKVSLFPLVDRLDLSCNFCIIWQVIFC